MSMDAHSNRPEFGEYYAEVSESDRARLRTKRIRAAVTRERAVLSHQAWHPWWLIRGAMPAPTVGVA